MNERDGFCERCGASCRAIGQQIQANQVPVFTPDIAQQVARWCPVCQKVYCGKCCGISSSTLGFVEIRCPVCFSKVEFARNDQWPHRRSFSYTPSAAIKKQKNASKSKLPSIPSMPSKPEMPPPPPAEPILVTGENKECLTCGMKIKAAAEVCAACGAKFEVYTRAYCTKCRKLIHTDKKGNCPDCQGSDLLDPRLHSKLTAAGIPPVKPLALSTPEATAAVTGLRPACASAAGTGEPVEGSALAAPAGTNKPAAVETKQCPCCAETIKAEARLCRFCGARFEVAVKGYCTTCHAEVVLDENDKCSRCGGDVIDRHIASTLVDAPAPSAALFSAPPAPGPRPAAVAAPIAADAASPVTKAHMPFWQLYFSPKGRIGRLTFFLKGLLPVWGLLLLCTFIFLAITASQASSRLSDTTATLYLIGVIILLVVMLLLIWVILMLIVKRFHDLDRSGWNILLWLIPLVGQIISIVSWINLYFLKGSDGPNRFGDSAY
jgi:uncharacterized membrane protein YhaH (DUF805 family)